MMLDSIPWPKVEKVSITPASRISISEWTESKRVLSDASEERGALRLIRTPYLKPILNCFQDPDVHTVVFGKSAQIAGTECFISLLGYYSDQEPCPMMFVLADESTATYMARERIMKMYRNAPELEHHWTRFLIRIISQQGNKALSPCDLGRLAEHHRMDLSLIHI